ncbi:Peroxidase 73 [Zea mays]|uniref:peroxidase n=1 Tax=Zea mays TaxID=4577 RepID=A0A1D6L5P9_MAIZE|nr:Peroxidase 73 [Zea mays]
MGAGIRVLAALLAALAAATAGVTAQLRQDYYAAVCPDLESIVRAAVSKKVQAQPVAVGATIRLFFHDCFVEGCDASVILVSTGNNTAEKDHPSNLSLAGDGFDTVIQAKAAVDAVPACANQVSCADILALATRDVIELAGGPSYAVELGRLDGLVSMSTNVDGKLPPPSFNLDQLTSIFALNNLSQAFDNQYFANLVDGRGLFASDQVLFSDARSQPTVVAWAQNATAFEQAFVDAITRLGRVGVKTDPSLGDVRRDCAFLN